VAGKGVSISFRILSYPIRNAGADLLGKHRHLDVILRSRDSAQSNGELSEKTLFEPQGGIEVETTLGRKDVKKGFEPILHYRLGNDKVVANHLAYG